MKTPTVSAYMGTDTKLLLNWAQLNSLIEDGDVPEIIGEQPEYSSVLFTRCRCRKEQRV